MYLLLSADYINLLLSIIKIIGTILSIFFHTEDQ